MKKLNLLIVLFFTFLFNALAQPTIQWQKSFGGVRMDKINAVIRTTDNGYLVVGQTASVSTQGRLDTMQAAVIRLNTEGVVVWQFSYGGVGVDIANGAVQTPNGFAIVGESTSKDALPNKGGIDAWIFTIDEKGTLLRQYSFGGTGNESFKNVILTANSSVTAIGYSTSNDGDLRVTPFKGNKDVLIARFSISEVLPLVARLFGGKLDDEGVSIVAASDTTAVIAATTSSTDGDVVGNKGASDMWAFEVGSGAIRWQRSLGGKNGEKSADLIKNTEGYLLAGTTTSNDGDVKGFKGISDIWAVQLDTKGAFLRQNCIGGALKDEAAAIVADTVDKTYVIIGSTDSKDSYVLSPHGTTDWSVSKIDNALKVVWHKCLGGSNIDNGCDLVLAKDGGLLAVGGSNSNDGNVFNGEINGNGWVVKLNRKNLSFYDDRQLIVRFRDGFTRDSALFYQKYYKAKQINSRESDVTCAGLIQLWQIDTFPIILPNGDTLKDIIEVSSVIKGKPEETSGEPNYAFANGIDVDSIYTSPQFSTLMSYNTDSTNVLGTCQRTARDSAIILAIIDSGIDTIPTGHVLHQKYLWRNMKEGAQGSATDLDGNGYKGDKIGWDFVENDAYPYDTRGHGSHVTGIIAKMLDKHKGDSVKLMPLRIFDASGHSSLFSLVQALTYAICNNANVVNMSLTYTTDSKLVQSSVVKYLIDFGGIRQKLLAVAAAGNYKTNIDSLDATERFCPAFFDSKNLLVVASVDPEKNRSSFSNFGEKSVDVAAPGDFVFSTLNNNKWGFLSGTSMSTPFVSASAALIGTKRCTTPFDYTTIRNAIESTVIPSTGLSTIVKKGFVNFCAARQSFLNTLSPSCLTALKEAPSIIQRFSTKTNPFSSDLTILCESSESSEARMVVTDAIGKQLLIKNIYIQAGENILPIDMSDQGAGLYFISIQVKDKVITLKAVKM